jgi:hypothetical protein
LLIRASDEEARFAMLAFSPNALVIRTSDEEARFPTVGSPVFSVVSPDFEVDSATQS